jgi:methylmalonyl-CoA mutase N-terminal domain/subunit
MLKISSDFAAGFAPIWGPYTTMYVRRPWTIRQYAGFSTAEESNAFTDVQSCCGPKRPRPLHLIYQLTVAMTQTTNAWLEM